MTRPLAAVYVTSDDALKVARDAAKAFDELGVAHSLNLVSPQYAHDRLEELVKGSQARAFIAVSDAPALANAVAALTMRPVVHVPVGSGSSRSLGSGVPVATIASGQGEDAALVVAATLALVDEKVQGALASYRERRRQRVLDGDDGLQERGHT